tara:strand:- start:2075 stop:2275 length:201 start_codon:yes stop_codon:yes gene_type:complete
MQEFATTEYNIFLQAILDGTSNQAGSAFGTTEDDQLANLVLQYGVSDDQAAQIIIDYNETIEDNQN